MADREKIIVSWLRLSMAPGIGRVLGARLVSSFGAPEAVFEASYKDISRVEGVGENRARGVLDSSLADKARRAYDRCLEKGVKIVAAEDKEYPAGLLEIPDPPLLLYVLGELDGDEEAVGIVGCRNPDPYGESVAVSLASGLARRGVTVVSGMARGVDGVAQSSAIKAGGRTIAVLGTGVDVVYPPEHRGLYEKIIEKGAVISELPLGSSPDRKNFPARNRIISGISKGVIVVQAMSEKSGALITVRHALEQNREVYAVPGAVGSPSGRVCNGLIKKGAKLVETAEDVILDLRPLGSIPLTGGPEDKPGKNKRTPNLPDDQARVYALVPAPSEGAIDLDGLARQSGFELPRAVGALLELELSGLVRALPGKMYVRMGEV